MRDDISGGGGINEGEGSGVLQRMKGNDKGRSGKREGGKVEC